MQDPVHVRSAGANLDGSNVESNNNKINLNLFILQLFRPENNLTIDHYRLNSMRLSKFHIIFSVCKNVGNPYHL